MLRFENICKRYGTRQVLKNVSGCANSFLRIDGPSGSGKTTLIRILLGLECPDSGTVHREGAMSAVFQEDRLCGYLTAAQNIGLVLPGKQSAEWVRSAMEKVGLTEEIWNTPAELLSGGQRRRVALLRALLAPAQNILLDEPFTGLDDAALEQAMRFTKQQVQNRTLILATHNPVTAEFFGGPVLHLSGT